MKKLTYGLWITVLLAGLAIVSGCASIGTTEEATWSKTATKAHAIGGAVIQAAHDLLPAAQVCLASEDYVIYRESVETAGMLHALAGKMLAAGDENGYYEVWADLAPVITKITTAVATIQKTRE